LLEVPLTSTLEVPRLPLVILGAGDQKVGAYISLNKGDTLESLMLDRVRQRETEIERERERARAQGALCIPPQVGPEL
jgi:hypothetical protein